MADKLLPCPFCGGDAHVVSFNTYTDEVYAVECSNCVDGTVSVRRTQAEAIEAWNTRTERTCTNVGYYIDGTRFKCSECGYNGWTKWAKDGEDKLPNFCPNCGAKAVS